MDYKLYNFILVIGLQNYVMKGITVTAPECKTTMLGTEYNGITNVTISGRICQRWESHVPWAHPGYNEDEPENYCRNPDNTGGGPWCYTMDTNLRWEYCDIPFCPTEIETTVQMTSTNDITTSKSTSISTTFLTTANKQSTTTSTEIQTTAPISTSNYIITSKLTTISTSNNNPTSVSLTTINQDLTSETRTSIVATTNIQLINKGTQSTVQTISTNTSGCLSCNTLCLCACSQIQNKWAALLYQNLTHSELKEALKYELDYLVKVLTVDKKSTSAAIRRRTSAPDDRKSSAGIGVVAIVIISMTISLFVIVDCINFICIKNR